jgi:hypothetical protein
VVRCVVRFCNNATPCWNQAHAFERRDGTTGLPWARSCVRDAWRPAATARVLESSYGTAAGSVAACSSAGGQGRSRAGSYCHSWVVECAQAAQLEYS